MLSTQTFAAFAGLETAERLTLAQIEERGRALRDQLSLDEKVSLMHGQLPFWPGLTAMAAPGGYSSQVWVAGEMPRLGIPGIRFSLVGTGCRPGVLRRGDRRAGRGADRLHRRRGPSRAGPEGPAGGFPRGLTLPCAAARKGCLTPSGLLLTTPNHSPKTA
jgi:hypothetical protein